MVCYDDYIIDFFVFHTQSYEGVYTLRGISATSVITLKDFIEATLYFFTFLKSKHLFLLILYSVTLLIGNDQSLIIENITHQFCKAKP